MMVMKVMKWQRVKEIRNVDTDGVRNTNDEWPAQ